MGAFQSVPYFVLFFIVLALVPLFMKKVKPATIRPPYLCGDNINDDIRGLEFNAPGDTTEQVTVKNLYLSNVFGENKLTFAVNLISIAIIFIMFGVVI
jgi:ech hydrogenase subunit A